MRFKNKDLFWKFFITIRLVFEKNELSYHDYLLRQIFQLSLKFFRWENMINFVLFSSIVLNNMY